MRPSVVLSLLALAACGGSSNGGGPPPPPSVAILTISGSGIKTQTGTSAIISVPNPGFVQFVNSDSVAHAMVSTDPGCSPLNTGNIAPGASTSQITLTNTTTANVICNFTDSTNSAAAFTGQVTILTSNTGGSGY
jgi:hypothetical protein